MNSYCGFIEVWKGKFSNRIYQEPVRDIFSMNTFLLGTTQSGSKLIAVFKIKLK